jgi:uncharacterized protein YkwD
MPLRSVFASSRFSPPAGCRASLASIRSIRAAALLLFAAILAPGNSYSAQIHSGISASERVLFEALNQERTSRGLTALQWDSSLAVAAREHAALMARRNTLSHQLPGEAPVQDRATAAGARFSLIAENIAVAPDPTVIHSAWMRSPHHRENILDPELTVVGIAVVKGSEGLFAVQDFSQAVPNLNLGQQEQQVIADLRATGLRSTKVTTEARKTCQMDRGFAGTHPLSVVRFETTDLKRLPDDVERKLRTGNYRSAAVGACTGGDAKGFARFRIAVVLY